MKIDADELKKWIEQEVNFLETLMNGSGDTNDARRYWQIIAHKKSVRKIRRMIQHEQRIVKTEQKKQEGK